jgi:hypothetical protein
LFLLFKKFVIQLVKLKYKLLVGFDELTAIFHKISKLLVSIGAQVKKRVFRESSKFIAESFVKESLVY